MVFAAWLRVPSHSDIPPCNVHDAELGTRDICCDNITPFSPVTLLLILYQNSIQTPRGNLFVL